MAHSCLKDRPQFTEWSWNNSVRMVQEQTAFKWPLLDNGLTNDHHELVYRGTRGAQYDVAIQASIPMLLNKILRQRRWEEKKEWNSFLRQKTKKGRKGGKDKGQGGSCHKMNREGDSKYFPHVTIKHEEVCLREAEILCGSTVLWRRVRESSTCASNKLRVSLGYLVGLSEADPGVCIKPNPVWPMFTQNQVVSTWHPDSDSFDLNSAAIFSKITD